MGFLSLFKAESFFFIFSLQSGVVMSILVLAAMTVTSGLHIIYDLVIAESFLPNMLPFFLSLSYIGLLVAGIVIAFLGAYNESSNWMVIAAILTGVGTILYILLAILSFVPSAYDAVCIDARCPDHQWTIEAYWRKNLRKNASSLIDRGALRQNPCCGNKEKSSIDTREPSFAKDVTPLTLKSNLLRPLVPRIAGSDEVQRPLVSQTTDWSFEDHEKESKIKKKREDVYYPTQLTTKRPRPQKKYKLGVVYSTADNLYKDHSTTEPGHTVASEVEGHSPKDNDHFTTIEPLVGTEGTTKKDGDDGPSNLNLFAIILSVIFSIVHAVFLCYVVYGFLAFANELQREMYGYY